MLFKMHLYSYFEVYMRHRDLKYICVYMLNIFNLNLWFYQLGKKVEVKVTQLYPTLCDPMDYIVHGILQARILGWVVFPFSWGSS